MPVPHATHHSAIDILPTMTMLAYYNHSDYLSFDPTVVAAAGGPMSDEELRFHDILRRMQPMEAPPTRLITVEWSIIIAAFFCITTILGLLGNATVIIAVALDRSMRRSAMNLLLLNLAVADIFNLLTIVLEWSPAMLYGYPAWDFPAVLCPLTRYMECAFLFASILTQLLVCVERFIAIVYPMHARRLCTKQNVVLIVSLIWAVALTFSLPYALAHVKPLNSIKCTNLYEGKRRWMLYKCFEFMSAYALPCGAMVVLYSKVTCVLWAKNMHLHSNQGSVPPASRSTSSNTVNDDRMSRGETLHVRRGVIKMLVACVLLYFVCYSPIQGVFIAMVMFGPNSRPPYSVVLLLNALAVMCSAANPLLYTLFSRKFRLRIVFLLTCGRHGAFNSRSEPLCSFAKLNKGKNASEKDSLQYEVLMRESKRHHKKIIMENETLTL